MESMNQVAAELEQIRAMNGGILRPTDALEFARNPETALHGKLEWDDAKAGHAHRLEQVRILIRRVMYSYSSEPDKVETRLYHSLPTDRVDSGGYRTVGDIMSSVDMRTQLLDAALADADRWMQKYNGLEELSGVFAALENVRKRKAS
jgi:hypothetical protein